VERWKYKLCSLHEVKYYTATKMNAFIQIQLTETVMVKKGTS
jgi:hypothetical protein